LFVYRNRERLFAVTKGPRPSLRQALRFAPGLRSKRLANSYAYSPP
jgi:hypothetical protein